MSDVREHPDTSINGRLLGVTQKAAFASVEKHGYLPKTHEEAEDFWPHTWVTDAVKRAYEIGRADGAAAAKERIRSALGI